MTANVFLSHGRTRANDGRLSVPVGRPESRRLLLGQQRLLPVCLWISKKSAIACVAYESGYYRPLPTFWLTVELRDSLKTASMDDGAGALRWRRALFALLVCGTASGLLLLMAITLRLGEAALSATSIEGWFAEVIWVASNDPLGVAMLLCFSLTLPWTAIGFWNAVIGFAVMLAARNPAAFVAPYLRRTIDEHAPLTTSTALLICIRNEDSARLRRNLDWMLDGLVGTSVFGDGEKRPFHFYILSDSDRDDAIAQERQLAADLHDRVGAVLPVTYRRREQRTGYKAGNIRDFCERWGGAHDFAIVLDADSVMTPAAMLRLVRIMQNEPQLGILQTLVTGLPSASPFARVFQFGMRLGMRSYTLGAAAWQGDCGPYWGHNAIVRLAPFTEFCDLPVLPGAPPLGGHVLSHDQLEAVMMRRAGFEVRVLPEENGSWEENPPTLLEFIRRDLRWCQGNLQYLKLLNLPRLLPVSRCQLGLAIAMYLGPPAWLTFMVLGLIRHQPIRADIGLLLLAITLTMTFAPKLATLVDVLLRRDLRRAYGGVFRIMPSALLELLFSMLIAPVSAVAVTIFMLGLPFGREIGWTAQQRDSHGVALKDAMAVLWPQTLIGLLFGGWLWHVAPGAIGFWITFPLGLVCAVPVAMLTAAPGFGRALAAAGLCRIPEETHMSARPEPATSRFAPFAPAAE